MKLEPQFVEPVQCQDRAVGAGRAVKGYPAPHLVETGSHRRLIRPSDDEATAMQVEMPPLAAAASHPLVDLRQAYFLKISPRAQRMEPHPVAHLAGNSQHAPRQPRQWRPVSVAARWVPAKNPGSSASADSAIPGN